MLSGPGGDAGANAISRLATSSVGAETCGLAAAVAEEAQPRKLANQCR